MKAIFSTLTLAAVLVLAACGGGSKSLEAKKEKLEKLILESSKFVPKIWCTDQKSSAST